MSEAERPDLRLQQRDYLLRIARAMTARLEPEGVLTLVIRSAVEMAHGHSGAIALRQADGRLRVAVRYGLVPEVNLDLGRSPGDPARLLPPPAQAARSSHERPETLARSPAATGDKGAAAAEAQVQARLVEAERQAAELEAAESAGLTVVGLDLAGERQQMLALPLALAGEDLGMILVFRSEGAAVFTPLDSELLDVFADQAAVAIHNARLHARLLARERQLGVVVAYDPSGVLLADADGRVQLDNPALRLILGGPDGASLVGRPLAEVLRLEDPGGRPLPLALPDGSEPQVARGFVRRLDGSRGPFVQMTVTAVGGALGATDSFVADVVDLSAFKAAEDAKSAFLAGLSHELKTPLALIRGYAETLQMPGARDNAELFADAMGVILGETDHLTGMVDQLLSAAQWQAGGLRLQFDEVDVGALVEQLVGQFAVTHPDRDWRLVLAPELPTVVGDVARLREVFQNLVTNAWKYSEAGTAVTVSARADPDELLVAVTDQGQGIASADQGRVFERFVRATDRAEGAGLGLYLSRAIVEAHGGRITVASAPGRGSTFTVSLPLTAAEVPGSDDGGGEAKA